MAILSALAKFFLANPTLSLAILGAATSLVLGFASSLLDKSPRLAALYSILVKLFPDLGDPKALAADIWTLIAGKGKPVLPMFTGIALAIALSGCAAFKRDAKTVLDIVQTACVLAAPVDAAIPDLALACQIAEADIPLIEKIMAGRRAGAALKGPGASK